MEFHLRTLISLLVLAFCCATASGAQAASRGDLRFEPNVGEGPVVDGLTIGFEGASPTSAATGLGEPRGRSSYIRGNDPRAWRTGVPCYRGVRYPGVYFGVDAVYYGRDGRLEYDFVIAPGSDPDAIVLRLDGARGLEIDRNGDLVVTTDAGDIVIRRPVAFQPAHDRKCAVAAHYELLGGGRVGFRLGVFDATLPLVIDPQLEFSSYLGGTADDFVIDVALDSTGAVYITGETRSTDFPGARPLPSALIFIHIFSEHKDGVLAFAVFRFSRVYNVSNPLVPPPASSSSTPLHAQVPVPMRLGCLEKFLEQRLRTP